VSHSVCPWWLGYFSISPLGRWSQNPAEILDGYLRQDITALEPGPVWDCSCSNCFDRVGPSGKVVAVDIQTLSCSRAETSRGQGWPSEPSRRPFSIADLAGSVDFTVAFAGVDEFPDAREFFRQIGAASKSRASLLLAEPRGQVESTKFESQLDAARQSGFGLHSRPSVPRSHAAFLHGFPSRSS
jgi:hypothetical protein